MFSILDNILAKQILLDYLPYFGIRGSGKAFWTTRNHGNYVGKLFSNQMASQ